MGNKRNRRSRRVESQSSDRDENTSETSFTQGNATLVEVSEQNNHNMTQIEQQLNSKFEEILKGIRTNRESNLANDEEDAEDNRPSTSNPEKRHLRRKHASNNEIDKDKNQDNLFQSSEMYELHELRQTPTSFGVANETLDDKIIINENRQENADYHMMTGGLGLADYRMLSWFSLNTVGKRNKPGPAQVGPISKAQKQQKDFQVSSTLLQHSKFEIFRKIFFRKIYILKKMDRVARRGSLARAPDA